jgi:hypothetical protein
MRRRWSGSLSQAGMANLAQRCKLERRPIPAPNADVVVQIIFKLHGEVVCVGQPQRVKQLGLGDCRALQCGMRRG